MPDDINPIPSRRFRKWVHRLCGLSLFAIIAITVWFRFAADDSPYATLLLFGPRWVAIVPVAALALLALLAFSFKALLMCVVMAVIVAWPFMGFVPNLPTDFPRQCPSEMVRIVTFNADNKDADRARFKAFLEESNPDCVALEDANRFSEADFPAGWRVVDGGNGLKLAARHRVTLEDSLSDARIGTARGVAKFRVQFPTGDRTIAVIHLMTPRHGLEAVLAKKLAGLPELDAAIKQRDAGSRTARAWLGDTGELLICGDFNLPVESVIYQRDWATFNNAFSSCGSGFGHTMASRRGSVRIDHCLSRGSWTPTAITLGPDLGSAHLPVLADYRP